MFIPEKYVLKENHDAVDTTKFVVLKCKHCQHAFAVPVEEATKITVKDVCDNAGCQKSYDKDQAAIAVATMKSTTDTKGVIDKALAK